MSMHDAEVGAIVRAFVAMIADAVVERMRGPKSELVSQHESPLKRRHNRVVRERIARGAHGAYIEGRLHYLTQDALREELERGARGARPKPSTKDDIETRIRRNLEARGLRL